MGNGREPTGRTRWRAAVARRLAGVIIPLAIAGCSLDGLLNNDQVPANVTDPAITQTPEGALAAYHGTVAQFREAFAGGASTSLTFVDGTGLLSDELRAGSGLGSGLRPSAEDTRNMPEDDEYNSATYRPLQRVRAQAGQAIGLLTRYAPEQRAFIGHAYVLEGYAEVFLAELFCSGIPLSTLDFDGDYTLKPGSTTEQVFAHAVALFDTALTFVGDSARFVQLAAIGKGRALLGLGDYAAAAAAAAAVPDAYRYEVSYSAAAGADAINFAKVFTGLWPYSVADREGGNGLDYVTSGDPRVSTTQQGTNGQGYAVYLATNYDTSGASPILLANGVEARLVEAEAALQASNVTTWLAKLNALRTDGTFTVDSQAVVDNTVSPPDTSWTYDTLWHAGTGGVAGLAPLDDPGTADGRVDLLFRERAFWLFLTGHRQGDLRRLIRQYGREPEQVYPVGDYPGGYYYGGDVTEPIPPAERTSNPLFTGCASRGA